MIYYSFFFILFGFFATCIVDCSFIAEGMIGGYRAEEHDFTCQAVILGLKNNSKKDHLIGSGAIIADSYVLTSATCFLDENIELRMFSYLIEADTVDFKFLSNVRRNITEIYIPGIHSSLWERDIAVVKLNEPLHLEIHPYLSAARIPKSTYQFSNHFGTVASYGYTMIQLRLNGYTKKLQRFRGNTDYLLRYAFVRIVSDNICKNSYSYVAVFKQLCGVMISETPNQPWGLCSKDIGSPLIVHNQVVGIASRNSVDCDDTRRGCIYTKVSYYETWIKYIIQGIPETVQVFYNRPYVG